MEQRLKHAATRTPVEIEGRWELILFWRCFCGLAKANFSSGTDTVQKSIVRAMSYSK
jgi:hypothetical protein